MAMCKIHAVTENNILFNDQFSAKIKGLIWVKRTQTHGRTHSNRGLVWAFFMCSIFYYTLLK